jgi:hypothetical protein
MMAHTFLAEWLATPQQLPRVANQDELLTDLRRQEVMPFLYARLRQQAVWGQVPQRMQAVLADDFRHHSLRTWQMQSALEQAVAALESADIPVLLLKGVALGHSLYGSPAERPIGDLDLLIAPDKLVAARQALLPLGYCPQGLYWLTRWQQRYRAELPFVNQSAEFSGLLLELHWSLVELPWYIDQIPPGDVWHAATPVPDLPGAWLPDPAVLLLHACAHLALHHSSSHRLLWLLDIDQLARSPALSWPRLLELAGRWRLQLALRTMLQRTRATLATPLPADVLAVMAGWEPDSAERAHHALSDERPGHIRHRLRTAWRCFSPRQRVTYAAWLVLRALLWPSEQYLRTRRCRRHRGALSAS